MIITWKQIEVFETVLFAIGITYYLAFITNASSFMGESIADDPMSVMGFGLLLSALLIARIIQKSFLHKVRMMTESGAILCSYTKFEKQFHILAKKSVLIVALAMIPLYFFGLGSVDSNEQGKVHLYIGGFIGALMLSVRFGFGVASGIAAAQLANKKHDFILTPSHPDRSSGFGHLGYYYFEQALVLLLPAAFMVFWIVYIGLNINEIERSQFVEDIVSIANNKPLEKPIIPDAIDNYVVCSNGNSDAGSCPRGERLFIWGTHFYQLTAFNLIIFMFCWLLPSVFLWRGMQRYRNENITPEIKRMEADVFRKRAEYSKLLQTENRTEIVAQHQRTIDAMANDLAIFRTTPVFPIPLWTALTAFISNTSAIIGLLGSNLI